MGSTCIFTVSTAATTTIFPTDIGKVFFDQDCFGQSLLLNVERILPIFNLPGLFHVYEMPDWWKYGVELSLPHEPMDEAAVG